MHYYFVLTSSVLNDGIKMRRQDIVKLLKNDRLKNLIITGDQISSYKIKRIITTSTFSVFRYILLIAIGYIVIYPLLYMIVTAIRTPESYYDPGVVWIPDMTMQNFKDAFRALDYFNMFKNTFFVQVLSALIEIASCSLVAYGLSRFEFKLKKYLMILLICTILVPSQMIIIPMMINYSHLDFFGILKIIGNIFETELRPQVLNTPFTFWLPSIFGVGLRSGIMIFIYIQFFKGLPKELEEAAWIDGAGPLKTFLRIAVPSSGVVFLTVSIFSIVWHWNDYYLCAMFMNNNNLLSLKMAGLRGALPSLGLGYEVVNGQGGSIIMAACLLTILPPLIMYMILQRKFVKSIDRVGITG